MSVLKKAPRSFEIGFQDDRDDSTEPAHLLAREIVLRMRFEPGIMDRFYLRVFLEPACDFQRVRAMPFHPQRQCFQSAERQETVEGSRDCADRILQERDLIGQLLIFTDNNDAADHVGMPVQIFRGGMDHHVEAGFDRSLNPGRSKGVIGNADDLFFARNLRDGLDVDDL